MPQQLLSPLYTRELGCAPVSGDHILTFLRAQGIAGVFSGGEAEYEEVWTQSSAWPLPQHSPWSSAVPELHVAPAPTLPTQLSSVTFQRARTWSHPTHSFLPDFTPHPKTPAALGPREQAQHWRDPGVSPLSVGWAGGMVGTTQPGVLSWPRCSTRSRS